MTSNDLHFSGGVICLMIALVMLSPGVSGRIRRSPVWPLAVLSYLFLLSLAGKLLIPFYDKLDVNDEVAVPIILGGGFLLAAGLTLWRVFQMRRLMKGG